MNPRFGQTDIKGSLSRLFIISNWNVRKNRIYANSKTLYTLSLDFQLNEIKSYRISKARRFWPTKFVTASSVDWFTDSDNFNTS